MHLSLSFCIYSVFFYPALALFEQANCSDWIFVIYCHWQKYSFFWYPFHILPVELWEPSCKSSSLPVDRKYQKGQST